MRWAPLVIGGALVAHCGDAILRANQDDRLPTELHAGARVERSVGGRERVLFAVNLNAGEFVHAIVNQTGIDVVAEIASPDGTVVLRQDSPNGAFGPECIAYVSGVSGKYLITVSSDESPAAGVGRFDIHIAALRRAEAADADHSTIERWLAEAQQLREQNTGISRSRASDLFKSAVTVAERLGLNHELALSMYGAGLTHLRGGETREAVPYLDRAIALFSTNTPMFASAVNALGGAYDLLGDPEEARRHYLKALEFFRQTGSQTGEGIARNNLGTTFADTADWQSALAEYRKALLLFRAVGDVNREGLALYNVGTTYLRTGDLDRAVEYLDQALSRRRKSSDHAGEADALTSIGRAELERGQPERAIQHLKQALSLREQVGNQRSAAFTLASLGAAYLTVGDRETALPLIERAVAIRRLVGDSRGAALAQLQIARAQFDGGHYGMALATASEALAIHREMGDLHSAALALTAIAESESRLGRVDDALAHFEDAMTAIEKVRGRASNPEFSATYFARRRDTPTSFIELLINLDRANPSRAHVAAAFQISERGRSRTLLDLLHESEVDIRRGVDVDVVDRERKIRDLISVKTERLLPMLARDRNANSTQALLREIGMLEAEHEEVRGVIRNTSPAYASLTQPEPLNLAAVQQQLLDDDTSLVEYLLSDEVAYAWIVTRESVRGVTLSPRADIEKAARDVYTHVTARGIAQAGESPLQRDRRIAAAVTALPAALHRLSDLVIAPLGDLGAGTRLLIVADGALQYIPFGMLPGRAVDGTSRPLVVDHEIVTMPSASVLAVQREQLKTRARPAAGIAVIADPVFDRTDARLRARTTAPLDPPASDVADTSRILEHLATPVLAEKSTLPSRAVIPRLPFTRNEADAILAAAKGQKNFRAVDFAATKEAVLGGALKNYRIVHFATHGFLDTERPTLSSIVLSLVDRNGNPRDGFLRAQELYNLELNADLVVLSACQTGLGKSIEGEGLIGLTRGLMYAGAQRVVVSLWNVSDRATATLMGRFYRDMLTNGKTPAAALRAAQLEVMKIKGWENPYYWAPFVMQGDWR